MREGEVEKQLKALQQAIALVGEDLEALRRDHRAGMDALRLELKVLQRYLAVLHPDFADRLGELRADIIQETDPEAS